jgi:hypothetical protein
MAARNIYKACLGDSQKWFEDCGFEEIGFA